MSALKTILAELVGLVVDDVRFALSIVVWVGLAWLVLPRLHGLGSAASTLLFGGLAVILLESAIRHARR